MKKLIALFSLLLAAAAVRAALPQPDLIAKIHFAGAQKFSAMPGAAFFANEFSSAEALALRKQTADKLAPWLAGWLQKNSGAVTPADAAKLRPLLDDLQTSEWSLDARNIGGKPGGVFAIKLEPARLELWRMNLRGLPFEVSNSQGWLFCLFGDSAGKPGMLQPPAPGNDALDLDINWPRLAQWHPKLKELGLPETQFAVTAAADNNFHINGRFFFPENLALDLDPWRVPTNTVHQPFISFTAVRGFSAWLKTQAWAQPYELTPTPNQLFVWALPGIPYQTFAAIPFADSVDALAQAYARLQPVFETKVAPGNFLMPFTLEMTNNEISLYGAPFIAPYLQAVRKPAGQFLLAGAFPIPPRGKPLPPELFQRLAVKNLVFYHWEVTAERLPLALNLSQLGLMLTTHQQLGGGTAAMKWIQKIAPTLGNTVTEITQAAPDQLTFTRTAPGAFTAMELLALGNWLEAPNFPGCDLKLPPRKKFPRHPHPATLKAPAAIPAK